MNLRQHGISNLNVHHNLAPAALYEHAVQCDEAELTASGAISNRSYEKTGRSPLDKRIVENPESREDVWWGSVNIPLCEKSYQANRLRAIEFLDGCENLYVIDGFAGWDPQYRLKIRVICARPYHALFMHNMLIRPTTAELADFGRPDYTILNAGECAAEPEVPGNTSTTSVALNFEAKEMTILGTQYAGEMKKGVFTIMHYLMPKAGILSMHCSANQGDRGDVALFFGLSGTGKTTLSADASRSLIGDDEHCWTDQGIFNIEGGCYAKVIDLSAESEPEIFNAIRFGTVLENTFVEPETREVDYSDTDLTQNTRAAYPIDFIENAADPCIGDHPKNIILLTCDAFGVLPPVSRLTPEQTSYYFLNGYTAKVAGTEMGISEPEATFSTCFGAAFLVHTPNTYSRLLAKKMKQHQTSAWLVNTGWSGGGFGEGRRISLPVTRNIINAIHNGLLANTATVTEPIFGLEIPVEVPGCPSSILIPRTTWADPNQYDRAAEILAQRFHTNFAQYVQEVDPQVVASGPIVSLRKTG